MINSFNTNKIKLYKNNFDNYFNNKKYEKALLQLEKIQFLDVNYFTNNLLNYKVIIFFSIGDISSAIYYIQKVDKKNYYKLIELKYLNLFTKDYFRNEQFIDLTLNLKNYDKRYFKALAFIYSRNFKYALNKINKYLKNSESNVQLYLLRLKVNTVLKNNKNINEDIMIIHKLSPDNKYISQYITNKNRQLNEYMGKINDNLINCNFELGIDNCNKVLNISKFNFKVICIKIILMINNDTPISAFLFLENYLENFINLFTKNESKILFKYKSLLLNDIGIMLMSKGCYNLSLVYYNESLKNKNNDISLLYNIGFNYFKLKKYPPAHNYFKRIQQNINTEIDNNVSNCYKDMSLHYLNKKDYNVALNYINISISYNKNNINTNIKSKILHYNSKDNFKNIKIITGYNNINNNI